jgi:hypothetical protein
MCEVNIHSYDYVKLEVYIQLKLRIHEICNYVTYFFYKNKT